jgi:hypothetical protein
MRLMAAGLVFGSFLVLAIGRSVVPRTSVQPVAAE